MPRTLTCVSVALLPALLSATNAAAQQDNGPPTYAMLEQQSAEALAASEKRVKAWYADPEVQALKAEADGGKASAQIAFADRIRDDILGEIWSSDAIVSNMLKYYAMAMEQGDGTAFLRVGEIAESPDYYTKMRRERDRSEALSYFEQGAELGNRDALAGYLRIVLDPAHCSFCVDRGEYEVDFKRTDRWKIADGKGEERAAAYREEKAQALAKAIELTTAGRLRPGDKAAHTLAAAYLTGVQLPYGTRVTKKSSAATSDDESYQALLTNLGAQWLLPQSTEKALEILVELSMRGDILASRKLGALYLDGHTGLAKDADKFVFYMKRAADNGSVIAANDVGFELLAGKNIPANHARGFEFIAKAAMEGYGPAELTAGYALREGRGVARDDKLALEMFKRAAEHGELDGAVQAAAMYRAGQGTDSGRVEVPNAYAYEKKAEEMRKLTPEMAEFLRRANRDRFE
ncbi:tetratricopeptide repeat protein [Altererythrobacter epoxidivorans]|uniref:tetratricopeptide repeat protein n=1 Tax=Altererythrobacter epoxidivorans TaxID=361183 RepID=UPI0009F85B5C|nr:tetratricopeptide repeat protein [Altererythrobacter epoxidivorans]